MECFSILAFVTTQIPSVVLTPFYLAVQKGRASPLVYTFTRCTWKDVYLMR
jgi:hypothetical protein